jgi:hypothetical protein
MKIKITTEEMEASEGVLAYRSMVFDRLKDAGFKMKWVSFIESKFEILDDYETWTDRQGNRYIETPDVHERTEK